MNFDHRMELKMEQKDEMEEKVDLALRVAANPTIPVGMENRVQRRVAVAAHGDLPRRTWLLAVPASCAALAIVLLAVGLHWRSPRKQAVRPLETARVSSAIATEPQQELRHSQSAPFQISAQPARNFKRAADHERRRHAANLFSYPLTRQERLLVEFARNAKPADLQILNPEYQAKVEATENAEFAAYLKSGDSSADETQATTPTQPTTQE